MKVERIKLLEQLELVIPGLSAREITEQSSCFIFQNGKVITFNDEISCTTSVEVSVEGAVPARPLLGILQKIPNDYVDIKMEDEKLIIKTKKKTATIRTQITILNPIDLVDTPTKWKKLPKGFTEAIAKVKECAGKDETKFALTCIHLHPEYIEATDNLQAGRSRMVSGLSKSALVRKEAIKHIINLDITRVSETKKWIHFKNRAGLVLSCRNYTEKFPNLDETFATKGDKTILPKELKEAAELANVFIAEAETHDEVVIDLTEKRLILLGKGPSGKYKEIIKVKYQGTPVRFAIPAILLTELIQQDTKCQICIGRLKIQTKNFVYVTVLSIRDR